MQIDFHYYATYSAAYLAGYNHEESMEIAYSAQFVDCCSRTLLKKVHAPLSAATTQLQGELMEARTDLIGLQDITRIWSSFHFLPHDLHAGVHALSPSYKNKYRLICKPNGKLLAKTIELARGGSLQSAGIAMHVLADTWAHAYFAGTPSQVINNTNFQFYELIPDGDAEIKRPVTFRHNPALPDDLTQSIYTNSINNGNENSIMNLGHGRAGHLPDYSFARYQYLPAWGNYHFIIKDNPSDYMHAFGQMIYALKYLRGEIPEFHLDCYDFDAIAPLKDRIHDILTKRQLDACCDWKELGESLSQQEIEDFSVTKWEEEYMKSSNEKKDQTKLGAFILAAMHQKSMVTQNIFQSGNMLAGISVDYRKSGFKGIRDFRKLIDANRKREKNE